ncbi:MBL fold metallo-hydrolase [Leptospira kmetyi]|uniref:MBL fold metallo-hydrolase n=1 Tax=Leptospira kmetyi TaxID=408139 RepID=A0A5F1XJP1_9LEPT|nr:MBL fold metallo-hydrolase [Leptospira kmetyi]AYV57751.1 MBL fold metallo-hydrolase [Leptospira kmetyi]TGK12969.1 MBL fold metallo-hydrolase [Leptospira kmetyi]TGK34729.1 MBL fold metallo-hydrolase [Leptospira kmetyi]
MKILKYSVRFLSIVSVLSAFGCFLGAPLKKETNPWNQNRTLEISFSSWEEVFSNPSKLEVKALLTGHVLTGPSILIDSKNPKTPEDQKIEQWVPALSYLVRHPVYGNFLMDSGVPSVDEKGNCDFSLIGPLFNVPCRSERGFDSASQLSKLNIRNEDLKFVLISHLHWDHIGGMEALRSRGPIRVLISEEEAEDASKAFSILHGYAPRALSVDFDLSVLPKDKFKEMPILGKVYDLFGDGSVWIVAAHGHTEGELAVLLNEVSGPMLFTFDSSHLKAGFENEIAPGATVNKDKSVDIIRRMRSFAATYPKVKVIYGHEPTQWSDKRIVSLSGNKP